MKIFLTEYQIDNKIYAGINIFAMNEDEADVTNSYIDIYSNGFKPTTTDGGLNTSGSNYVYCAWAEQPFVNSNGVPCTAR